MNASTELISFVHQINGFSVDLTDQNRLTDGSQLPTNIIPVVPWPPCKLYQVDMDPETVPDPNPELTGDPGSPFIR